MATKKKAAGKKKPARRPRIVEGTPREHRAIDARELRDEVKNRTKVNGVP
jgi:hypothetical protein